ncbi:sex-regulated protein janus-A-like [Phlebotomus argentipes]|uniref:sex-regulated protein janus-A-like n=1 Tax=Phlebotomus argentipes TaxID=94469 RepID=UPI00289356C5|nr:sex-regulated protein janus-A-like [Phlebotomus argentipes]
MALAAALSGFRCQRNLLLLSRNLAGTVTRGLTRMVDAKLDAVETVRIDEGRFKYILIKVYGKEQADGTEPSKLIVRGFQRSPYHSDIYDEVSGSLQPLGLDSECLGGGKIEHRPDLKHIRIFSYSQGFGKADHHEAKKLLLTKYPNYKIEVSESDEY